MTTAYQNYLAISSSATRRQEITSLLGASPFSSRTNPENILLEIRDNFPSVLILDLLSDTENGLQLITNVRNQHPLANIPIIVITERKQKEISKKLQHFQNINEIDHTKLSSQLQMYVEMVIDEHFLERGKKEHPYTAEFFADIWREGVSGTILLENGRSFSIQRGGLVRPQDQKLVAQCLMGPPPVFRKTEGTKNGDWIALGEQLWKTAISYYHSGFLRHRKWLRFVPTKDSFRAFELDIKLETRRLLFGTTDDKPLIARMREHKITIPQIERDIEALFLLGLYQFLPIETNDTTQENTTEISDSELIPHVNWEQWLLDFLQEEWKKRTATNPWSAFLLQPKDNLQQQLANKREKYTIFATLQHPTAQRKYQQLLDHLDFVEPRLRKMQHLYQLYAFPENEADENIFFQALNLLECQQFAKAKELLGQLPKTPRYQAYFGWSIFLNDPSSAKEAFEVIARVLKISKQHSLLFQLAAIAIQIYLQQWQLAKKKLVFLQQTHHSEQTRLLFWFAQHQTVPPMQWFYRLM